MLTDIRLLSHQLAKPRFRSPKELVAWMGAVQAQEYTMAKWAVGTRLKSSSLRVVDDALAKGEILRTHILRPTWHFIVAEDIRWMLQLSGGRIRTAFDSYARSRKMEITEASIRKVVDCWNNCWWKQEFDKTGVDGWFGRAGSRQTIT